MLLLFAAIATMLPLRPGLKGLSRQIMHQRIAEVKAGRGTQIILISSEAIPANAWEGDEEFRLNGKRYDVAAVCTVQGIQYYRCLSDDVEVAAEETADNLVRDIAAPNPASRQSKLSNALMDWLSQLFYEPHSWQQAGLAFGNATIAISAPINDVPEPMLVPGLKPPQC